MTVNRWTFGVFVLTGMLTCTQLEGQVKGDQDITGPYEVVEDWLQPLPWHSDGWTFGLVAEIPAIQVDRNPGPQPPALRRKRAPRPPEAQTDEKQTARRP